jgi:hypothetical protein
MYVAGGGKLPKTLLIFLKNGKTRDYLVGSFKEENGNLVVYGAYITTGYSKRLTGDTKVLDPRRSKKERPSFIDFSCLF